MTHPFLNFNGAAVDVWEWLRDFIPHAPGYVITYQCRYFMKLIPRKPKSTTRENCITLFSISWNKTSTYKENNIIDNDI